MRFFFVSAAILLFISLWSCNYGPLGRYPSTWLTKDVMEGNNQEFGYTLAIVLYQYEERISLSDKTNSRRAKLNNAAILVSILGVVILFCRVVFLVVKTHFF